MSATPQDAQAKLTQAVTDLGASPPNLTDAQTQTQAALTEIGQLLTPPPPPATPVPVGVLLFGDDFNGTALDTTKWGVKSGKAGNGQGYWDPKHAALDGNGNLVITAQLISGVWHTAFISGKKSISGPRYIEALASLPEVNGQWSAPTWEWAYPYGAGGLEVDVSEQLGDQPGEYHFTLHNWDAGKQYGKLITTGGDLSKPHRYGCAVYKDHADAYFDGKLMASIPASAIGFTDLTAHAVCENIDLNVGGWGGTVVGSGPYKLVVDYLHVWALA